VLSQHGGKDYLEDALIVIKALTISPPSKDRYYGDKIFSTGIVDYVSIIDDHTVIIEQTENFLLVKIQSHQNRIY
jgi:hypothetical protein